MKHVILLTLIIFSFQHSYAQKKYIKRKIAQKNYDGYILMQAEKYDTALLIFNELSIDIYKSPLNVYLNFLAYISPKVKLPSPVGGL